MQIEIGFLLGSSQDNGIKEQQISVPTTLIRYGITKGIELRLQSQYESVKNNITSVKVEGLSDLEFGTKIQIFKKENRSTEIAFLSHLVLPTASRKLTNAKFGTINKFSISHSLSKSFGIGYNLGYNYFGSGPGDLTYSLAIGIGLFGELGLYFEPYGEFLNFETHIASFDAGLTYLLQNHIQLDVSLGTGLNHTLNYVAIGCSINIAKKDRD